MRLRAPKQEVGRATPEAKLLWKPLKTRPQIEDMKAAYVISVDEAQSAKTGRAKGNTRGDTLVETIVDMRPRMEYLKALAELVIGMVEDNRENQEV